MAGIPGKHIYELDNLKILKSDSLFAISQDNLTRAVSLDDLKLAFSGDSDEASNNSYYSTEYMQRYFASVTQSFLEVNTRIDETNAALEQLRADMADADTAIKKKMQDNYDHWQDTLYRTTEGDLGEIPRINAIFNVVTKFSSGTAIPTSLAPGEVYIQYF